MLYKVGQPIYWRPSKDGTVRGWVVFDGGMRFNAGDPEVKYLIAVADIGGDVGCVPRECLDCSGKIGGSAIEIQDNVIVRAWAFPHGELLPGKPAHYHEVVGPRQRVTLAPNEAQRHQITEYYSVDDAGELTPRLDWEYSDDGIDYFWDK